MHREKKLIRISGEFARIENLEAAAKKPKKSVGEKKTSQEILYYNNRIVKYSKKAFNLFFLSLTKFKRIFTAGILLQILSSISKVN